MTTPRKDKDRKSDENPTIAQNKRARYEYFIEEKLEAGLALQGWEVKSLRAGKAQITEGYVIIKDGEAFLIGAHITPLRTVSTHIVADPTRTRKLLLNRRELDSLVGAVERKGHTIVPLELYWSQGKVKLEIGVAKGKQAHDKRDTEKDRDWQREKSRLLRGATRLTEGPGRPEVTASHPDLPDLPGLPGLPALPPLPPLVFSCFGPTLGLFTGATGFDVGRETPCACRGARYLVKPLANY